MYGRSSHEGNGSRGVEESDENPLRQTALQAVRVTVMVTCRILDRRTLYLRINIVIEAYKKVATNL